MTVETAKALLPVILTSLLSAGKPMKGWTMAKRNRRTDNHAAWFRSFDGCWYLTPAKGSKPIKLRDEAGNPIKGPEAKELANIAAARLKLATNNGQQSVWYVGMVIDKQKEHLQKAADKEWAKYAAKRLDSFRAYCGGLDVRQLLPDHLTKWLDANPEWDKSKSQVKKIIRAAFNYCEAEHKLPINPLKKVKTGQSNIRLTYFDDGEAEAILAAANGPFADLFGLVYHTGARPKEIASLTADMFHDANGAEGARFILHQHKTAKKTGKARVIYLSVEALAIARKLMLKAPKGSGLLLCRNRFGNGWTRRNLAAAFRKLANKLHIGKDRSLYTCRHDFAKRKLAKGIAIHLVAKLMGNTVKMVEKVYGQEWERKAADLMAQALAS